MREQDIAEREGSQAVGLKSSVLTEKKSEKSAEQGGVHTSIKW